MDWIIYIDGFEFDRARTLTEARQIIQDARVAGMYIQRVLIDGDNRELSVETF